MKRIYRYLFLLGAILFVGTGSIYAQSAEDIYRISFTNRASLTARSAAMGGAFTSLGADAASIFINPAGLGMYRSSEITITPSLFVSSATSLSDIDNISIKKNKTKFTLSNFSAVYNIFKDNKQALTGLTFGLSYSKENYTNYNATSESSPSHASIGDYFSGQLYGIKENLIKSSDSDPMGVYRNTNSGIWGAMMAYNTFLIDPTVGGNGVTNYAINPNNLKITDYVSPSQMVENKSIIDNFSVSAGFNIDNTLYLGASLGGRMYEYHKKSHYRETDVAGNQGIFGQLDYMQHNNVIGSAFDFKVGAIVEPLTGLRVGAAFHAPTITFIEDEYYADMDNYYYETANSNVLTVYNAETPYDPIKYKVKSAPKFLSGISYRLPFAILSFDYERVWYNKMNVRGMNGGADGLNQEIADTYKPVNNFMAGLEIQPIQGFFLRAGYARYNSALRNEDKKYGVTENISAGIGFRSRSFYMDFAYINSSYKKLPFKYYGGYFPNPANPSELQLVSSESIISPKFNDTMLSLTFGVKF